jgi:hypothetical protein
VTLARVIIAKMPQHHCPREYHVWRPRWTKGRWQLDLYTSRDARAGSASAQIDVRGQRSCRNFDRGKGDPAIATHAMHAKRRGWHGCFCVRKGITVRNSRRLSFSQVSRPDRTLTELTERRFAAFTIKK